MKREHSEAIIVVHGCTQQELERDLADLTNEYNGAPDNPDPLKLTLDVELHHAGGDYFAITFPRGVSFRFLCYIVNFLRYPFRKHTQKSTAIAHLVLQREDEFIPKVLFGQQVNLFSDGDSEAEAFTIYIVSKSAGVFALDLEDDHKVQSEAGENYHYAKSPIDTSSLKYLTAFKGDPNAAQNAREARLRDFVIGSRVFFALAVLVLSVPAFAGRSISFEGLMFFMFIFVYGFSAVFSRILHKPPLFVEWTVFGGALAAIGLLFSPVLFEGRLEAPTLLATPLVIVVSLRYAAQWYHQRRGYYPDMIERGPFQGVFLLFSVTVLALLAFAT